VGIGEVSVVNSRPIFLFHKINMKQEESRNLDMPETIITFSKGTWTSHDYYLLSRKIDTRWILYIPTLKVAMLLTNDAGQRLANGEMLAGIERRLLDRLCYAVTPLQRQSKSFHLAIGLTQNCSLRCSYCHADADKDYSIDDTLLESAIEYGFLEASKTPSRTLSASFAVGGEPTLRWDSFCQTVNRFRDRKRQTEFGIEQVFLSMTTNGYYGIEKRTFVGTNFDSITISIDGPPSIHDMHRPGINGETTYKRVAETAKYLIDCASSKITLRSTVSSQSVEYMDAIVEHFASEFGSGLTISFEPLVMVGRALVQSQLETPATDSFAKNFWKARLRGKQLGVRVIGSGANMDRLVNRFCGAMAIPSFTVCIDGTITACHRDQDGSDYGYGKLHPNGQVDIIDERIMRNIELSVVPQECNDCFLRWHCAGDCPDIRRVGYSRCAANQYFGYMQLLERLESAPTPTTNYCN
jgi:uncharacterized protein